MAITPPAFSRLDWLPRQPQAARSLGARATAIYLRAEGGGVQGVAHRAAVYALMAGHLRVGVAQVGGFVKYWVFKLSQLQAHWPCRMALGESRGVC